MRKLAVFTGTRAEYGLLYWLIKYFHEADNIELQLIVGGMHLSPEFGNTVNDIEKDGFPISERLEFLLSSDTPVAVAKSMGLATISAADSLARLQPDMLVILGDRFETMAVAQAALPAQIPIAHIHGGETTEGAIDEAIRHSLTKMSQLHFPTTNAYKKRIIQLGEQEEYVFNFGAPGIDNITRLPLLDKKALSESLDFELGEHFFLITYHPVTLGSDGASQALKNLLTVLDEYDDHQCIITYPNADTHGRQLIKILDDYQSKHPDRVLLSHSLGQVRYLSAMKHASAVVGNSSSGIIEAPTFGIPTVNIGHRQLGRLAGDTVIHCDESTDDIRKALQKAFDPTFLAMCMNSQNPYGNGDSSEKIAEVICQADLSKLKRKSFNDLI